MELDHEYCDGMLQLSRQMNCLQALQTQSRTLTAEANRLSQQLQMLQKDMQGKQQLLKHTRYIQELAALMFSC